MPAPGCDRFFAELRGCTAEFARIIDGDLERPVPTCPGWTFQQLATHLGRGHRWAAQIVATRATMPIPMREVADGKLPQDPAQHASWLNAGADQVIEAVTAAGSDLVWTLAGIGPASFWARRRAHEAAVHLADAQLAAGLDVDLAPEFAANGVDEWLARIAARHRRPGRRTGVGPARKRPEPAFPRHRPRAVRRRRVAGHADTVRSYRRPRPRQSRRRRPRARSQPAAHPDPSATALQPRHRNPRRAGTAHPLAPAHAVLTDPRFKNKPHSRSGRSGRSLRGRRCIKIRSAGALDHNQGRPNRQLHECVGRYPRAGWGIVKSCGRRVLIDHAACSGEA